MCGSEFPQQAMAALLQDWLRNQSATARNLAMSGRMQKLCLVDDNDDWHDYESDAVQEVGNPVAIWLADPNIASHRDLDTASV